MSDAKRRTEEEFAQTLIYERGQEREEYESKIKELNQALKKSNALQENEETIVSRVSGVFYFVTFFSFIILNFKLKKK